MKHIGIVACSAEGAALCYRTICTEAPALLGKYAHPEVTVHTFSLADYMRDIEAGDWQAGARIEAVADCNHVLGIAADTMLWPKELRQVDVGVGRDEVSGVLELVVDCRGVCHQPHRPPLGPGSGLVEKAGQSCFHAAYAVQR